MVWLKRRSGDWAGCDRRAYGRWWENGGGQATCSEAEVTPPTTGSESADPAGSPG
jgi:hypothetical protein